MARLGVSKKKKSPRATELSQLKKELKCIAEQLNRCQRDLAEATEQHTATSEILRVIAGSPTELQPVLDNLLANAVKLSGATRGHIRQPDGEFLRVVAHCDESPERIAVLQSNPLPLNPNIPGARAFLDRKPVHVHDARLHAGDAQFIAQQTIPTSSDSGVRTLLAVPLLREGTGIGTLILWRDFVEPFTDRQIELVAHEGEVPHDGLTADLERAREARAVHECAAAQLFVNAQHAGEGRTRGADAGGGGGR